MFFKKTFRNFPLLLIIVSSFFLAVSQALHVESGELNINLILGYIIIFTPVFLITSLQSVEFKEREMIVRHPFRKTLSVRYDDSVTVKKENTIWGNYSPQVSILIEGRRVFKVMYLDAGLNIEKNMLKFLSELKNKFGKNLSISKSLADYLEGTRDFFGKRKRKKRQD